MPTYETSVSVNINKYLSKYGITNPAFMVYRRATPILAVTIEKYLSGRILDIGCGSKNKELLMGENIKEYIGLDHPDSRHDQSKVDIFGTAYSIPDDDKSYDGVLCSAVLEHLEEPKKALYEAKRVLRTGGYGIYTIPFFWHLHEEPRDFYRYSYYGIEYLFNEVGFEIISIMPLSGFWITFGSELNYYLQSLYPSKLKYLTKLIIAINNIIFPVLDSVDRNRNAQFYRWSWLHLVVVRKPTYTQP